MGLDDDDTPVGEIVALVLVAAIVILILIVTFESCAEFEHGREYTFCEQVVIEIGPVLGEQTPCWNDKGEVEFSVLSRSLISIEGIEISYRDTKINKSVELRPISQEALRVHLGFRAGHEFTHINITPIVYYDDQDMVVMCARSMQRIMRLSRCGVPT